MAFSSVHEMIDLCKESGKPLYEVILESDLAESGLTRAEACTVVNNMLGRTGDAAQATRLIALGIYSDVSASYWGARTIAEASVSHTAAASGSAFLAAALCALWFALDVCGLLPPALTLFALARGLSGNKLFLCLVGLAFTALAVSIRLRADSSRQT